MGEGLCSFSMANQQIRTQDAIYGDKDFYTK